ncbi:TPA: rhodanese-like domain-containing protein [Mannheimia haemolytica]|nr:rhodanese-like domain-containing protein [Mannheimia haemolytica]
MKKLAWILGFAAMMPMMSSAKQASVQQVQAEKAAGIWIDVRSAKEFQQGHLNGAINVTHTEIAQRIAEVAPDKNQPIHLYCRSGHRAEAALNELKKLGYSNVTNHGGYDDLIKAGLK